MEATRELSETVGKAKACAAFAVSRSSFYRRYPVIPRDSVPAKERARPARSLSDREQARVLEVLNCERFMNLPPRQVYAGLLDEGTYLCSIRTMYRILEANGEVRERRDQLRHPTYQRPELVATGPNQVWSWDITKLLGPVKWTYFYLYVILDIFSRYVVSYMVARREGRELASRLIEEACIKQGIQPGQLTVHADRGPPMVSKTVALLLADLGVTKSHSRPHVSNDNPYSEAQFKTIKYRPGFPERFGSIQDSRAACHELFRWYNHEHYHTGIALLTPATVHHGLANASCEHRDRVLAAAYAAHPERFVNRPPAAPRVPPAVWINPPRPIEIAEPRLPGHLDPRSSILGHPGASIVGQNSRDDLLEPSRLQEALQ